MGKVTKKITRKKGRKLFLTVKGVLVKVPLKNAVHFEYVPRQHFPAKDGNPAIIIQPHYRHGYLANNNPVVIVFRHFYNVPEHRFGKPIVATVKLFEKIVPDVRKGSGFISYLYEDIFYAPGVSATTEHKFLSASKKSGGILIPRTQKSIFFRKMMVYNSPHFSK